MIATFRASCEGEQHRRGHEAKVRAEGGSRGARFPGADALQI